MLVCMHEENSFKNICCCSPFGCLYLLSDLLTDLMVAGPRWRFGTFSFLLYFSEVYQRTGRGSKAKSDMFIVLFWEILMIVWVAFRVEDCCLVINLKWVEYTGSYVVHSHLLRNFFALISTVFFYTHLDWNI